MRRDLEVRLAMRAASFGGSLTKTSSAAPAIRPLPSASASAASSTMPPRLAFTIRSDGWRARTPPTPISPVVTGVFGMCT